MENRRRVTEEDLLITEALISQSYGQLKQSVVMVPTRACRSLGQTVRKHPFATAAAAVIAGAGMYGIFKMMSSRSSGLEAPGRSHVSPQNDMKRPNMMHELLLLMIPLAAPYIMDYIRKYLE